ncbi:hypothetical protein ACWT_1857 [Actinoplanes sp. SE50]|uniref:SdpI family protein n=1 Tax=unclassified Actinoplanes TaxID=2626549 RepID=UPI00023EBB36|nr:MULTISPECIES: SdpI family protein [unclassified Actinoplanes]AEV82876.1 hypothetical protein ACPL_1979 [Actinoplanes sp. SE50/110]ATO81272.1 hypothetical protein ACWT_1857 [Actinoplanes sp. SE50]SLL98679.1 hypothetical protein ACSP50_1906 [Actinoplanes sp. SE50/110]
MALALPIAASFAVISALALIMARLVDTDRLDRNAAFGIRTAGTKRSDQAWKAGHRAAQPLTRALGITGLCFAILILGVAFTGARTVVTVTAVLGYAGMVTLLALMAHRADTAARSSS